MATNWLEFAAESKRALKGAGGEKTRARRAVDMFCSWADTQKLAFPCTEDHAEVLKRFRPSLDVYEKANGELKREGELTMETGARLLGEAVDASMNAQKRAQERTMAEALAAQEREALKNDVNNFEAEEPEEALSPEDNDMSMDDEQDDTGDMEYEEEAPAPKTRTARVAGIQQPVVMVNASAFRKPAAPRQAQPRIAGFQRPVTVLIEKVDEGGHTVRIDTFTADEMKGMTIQEFIENRIARRYMNEDGSDTEFIATQLGANGKPVGQPLSLEVEGEGSQQQQHNDPFRAVNGALNMVEQLKNKFGQPEQRPDATLEAMKQKALGSNDMSMMLMLMMMERNQRPVDNTHDLTRLVTTILEKQGVIPSGAPAQMPPMMMPPMPSESPAGSKLLDLALSKMAQPPPTAAEQMMEMLKMRQMMSELNGGGSNELTALKQELAALRAQLGAASAPRPTGLQDSVKEFETVTNLVKSLAPQITGEKPSGFGGFLTSMLTPQVGEAIRGAVMGAVGGAQGAPANVPSPPQAPISPAARQMQQPASAPAPSKPPAEPPVPQAVLDAEKGIALAQIPPAIAERFAALIMAMYQSGDERYLPHLNAAMGPLMGQSVGVEELKPARRLVFSMVSQLRPEHATPEFADKVLASLASTIGAEMPEVFVQTAGQWTVLFDGTVRMLAEFGAQKVEEKVETSSAPAPAPATPPQRAATPEEAQAFLDAQRAETAKVRADEEAAKRPAVIEPVLAPVAERVHA